MLPDNRGLPDLVQTPGALAGLVDGLTRQPCIAVDTESNSLHAYRERVCLIQFSTVDGDCVVDPLTLPDVRALGPVFNDARIEKVFHAAEYDILCLRRDHGFAFQNIFDTMQAGRILGRKLAGLDRLIEDKFGVKVSKRFQKADWGARPLSPELLEYAAQDTHYLIPLRDMLSAELAEKGMLELAQEDFRMACSTTKPEAEREGSPSWARFNARRDLTPRELTILKELLAWREDEAARLDRPPFKVVGEEVLLDVARAAPQDLEGLTALGLKERQVQQWGRGLLGAVARGLGQPVVQRTVKTAPAAAYLRRLEKLKEWRKKEAAALEVESDVVLPRGLLLALADRGGQELEAIMEPSPWRLRRFGDQISAALNAAGS